MKTYYNFSLALLLVAGLVLTGCFDEVAGPYDGPDRIAFAQVSGAFATSVSDGAGTIEIPTQLIGPQRSSGFTVPVSVQEDSSIRVRNVPQGDGTFEEEEDVRALPTTAASDNYNLPSSINFPANSSSGTLEVEILEGLPDDADPVRLTVRLDGNDGANIRPAENWRYFEITIQP